MSTEQSNSETWSLHDCGGSTLQVMSSVRRDQRRAHVCNVYFDYTDKDDERQQRERACLISKAPLLVELLQKFADPDYYQMPSRVRDEIRAEARALLQQIREGK